MSPDLADSASRRQLVPVSCTVGVLLANVDAAEHSHHDDPDAGHRYAVACKRPEL